MTLTQHVQPAQLPGQHERSSGVDPLHRDRGELRRTLSADAALNIQQDKGPELAATRTSALPGSRDRRGRRRPVERHALAGGSAAGDESSRHRRSARPAATCRCRSSASRRSRVSVTTRSRTSTCRRSSTAASRTRSLGVVSNGYIVLGGGDQCGHRVHAAALPERGTAEQRARTAVERPQPAGRPAAAIRIGNA